MSVSKTGPLDDAVGANSAVSYHHPLPGWPANSMIRYSTMSPGLVTKQLSLAITQST